MRAPRSIVADTQAGAAGSGRTGSKGDADRAAAARGDSRAGTRVRGDGEVAGIGTGEAGALDCQWPGSAVGEGDVLRAAPGANQLITKAETAWVEDDHGSHAVPGQHHALRAARDVVADA